MKLFVAALAVATAAMLGSAVAQTATKVAAKGKSYDQCYKDCMAAGSKSKNCSTRCASKG